MTARFVPKMEILSSAQHELWTQLTPLARLGFVLYGGTAVALRIGHRASVDFDFFTDQSLDRVLLGSALPFIAASTVLQEMADTLTVLAPGGPSQQSTVKLSLFGNISFGRVGSPEETSDGVLSVASPHDLLAHKLKVLLQRVEAKDYLDIAALLNVGTNLEEGLGAARALYGTAFQPSESLKALVYFEGGDLASLPSEVRTALIAAASRVRQIPARAIVARRLTAFDPN